MKWEVICQAPEPRQAYDRQYCWYTDNGGARKLRVEILSAPHFSQRIRIADRAGFEALGAFVELVGRSFHDGGSVGKGRGWSIGAPMLRRTWLLREHAVEFERRLRGGIGRWEGGTRTRVR